MQNSFILLQGVAHAAKTSCNVAQYLTTVAGCSCYFTSLCCSVYGRLQ